MEGIELLSAVQLSIGQGTNALCFKTKSGTRSQKVVIKLGHGPASRFCSTQNVEECHQINVGGLIHCTHPCIQATDLHS